MFKRCLCLLAVAFLAGADEPKPEKPAKDDRAALQGEWKAEKAQIGGKDAPVNYSGTAVGIISGAIQVNAKVPDGLAAGDAPVVMKVGGVSSQSGVTVAVSGK